MNNKGKLQTSKQLTLERSKPKYKITDKCNVLTNKHYMWIFYLFYILYIELLTNRIINQWYRLIITLYSFYNQGR